MVSYPKSSFAFSDLSQEGIPSRSWSTQVLMLKQIRVSSVVSWVVSQSVKDLLVSWALRVHSPKGCKLWNILPFAIMWALWLERNRRHFDGCVTSMAEVTRHAHRVYVGGLPAGADEQKIVSFFGHVLVDIGAHTGPALAVVNIHINREKNLAILEMSSVALASNTMALNGIIFEVSTSAQPFCC
ncbi:hypothetical protein IFM89_032327 [Coptis chinensis]|uniref:RRM domain-containing protein n=1 Tax=Coptis chinensis TaxID=261450 RepID=A0A835IGW6_9MAGN|nr:hypothetical protein IFM89_032327 [Coptis chinensis]